MVVLNDLQHEKILNQYKTIDDLKKVILVSKRVANDFINEQEQIKKQEIENTRQILKETAEKIKITEISTSLLLMAFNLDKLENLNKLTFEV